MKLVRFVTEDEMHLYIAGMPIKNDTNHRKRGANSSSVGSCFAEITEERDADKWLRKLYMIRPCEYCIEFDTAQFQATMNTGHATYIGDSKEDIYNHIAHKIREWCTTEYSRTTHPYTRIGKCPTFGGILAGQKIDWNWMSKEEEEAPKIQLVIGGKTYNVTEGTCKDCTLHDFCTNLQEGNDCRGLCLAEAMGNEFNNGKKKTFCFKEE